jgi:hypothetical protein
VGFGENDPVKPDRAGVVSANPVHRSEPLETRVWERLATDVREALDGAGCEFPRGFAVADEANATVSRKHTHIRLDDGEYRICDDASEFGTRIFRDGRSIDVPSGNRRGERLRPGDEIYLGRACLRFER